MLRRYLGFKPKQDHSNSCTPCQTLKPEIKCHDMCCRHYLVILAQEDLDDGLLTMAPFIDVIRKKASGACHYFDEANGNCGVWAKRPLVCRTYDCRDDKRAPARMGIKHPVGTAFTEEFPQRCTHCNRLLRLSAGVSHLSGGQAVCIDCGPPYGMDFDYRGRSFRIHPIGWVDPLVRRRYLLACLTYREQFAEAHALLDAWCAESPKSADLLRERALVLADLGRLDDCRRRLEPLREGNVSIELDLAWLDTKRGQDAAAKQRIDSVFAKLPAEELLRANLQLGGIARRANNLEEAARRFQKAILLDRTNPMSNHGLKEYLLELMHGSEESRERVDRGLLTRAQ